MPIPLAALPTWVSNLLPILLVLGVFWFLRKVGGT